MHQIAIIGAGQLGSRHLQGLAKLQLPCQVHVVDPSPKSLEVARQRFAETPPSPHVGGYFLVAQKFAECFKQQGHGNIVNMSSIYGVIAPRFQVYDGTTMTMPVEYAAIKASVVHLTHYFAQYFKGTGIRVNALSPGGILDAQPEPFLQRYRALCADKGMLDKSDLAGALVFLLSDLSRYMNGQNLVVDDGFSL